MNELKDWWTTQHKMNSIRYLTNMDGKDVWNALDVFPYLKPGVSILNIGVGTGRCTKQLSRLKLNVSVLDICREACQKVASCIDAFYCHPAELPENKFDLAISHLVSQHVSDEHLQLQISNVIRSLKLHGIFAMQFSQRVDVGCASLEGQKLGNVSRTKLEMVRIVELAGGQILKWCDSKYYPEEDFPATFFHYVHIGHIT